MTEEQKLAFFNELIPKDVEKLIDSLDQQQLINLKYNLSKMANSYSFILKKEIKKMAKKKK